ncbi:MAG: FAD-binding protein [Dorea sp.]
MFDDIKIEKSKVEILEELPAENTTDSILGAEVVVVGGRGVLEDDNFELLEKFAEKVGGAIGGTRPMVDSEMIPFNHPDWTDGTDKSVRRCVSPLVYRSNSAYRRNQGYKFICCSQYRRKCCDFWSCRLRNPGRFKRNSGELPDTVM